MESGSLFEIGKLALPQRGDNENEIRRRNRCVYLHDDLSICRVLGRYKMFVDNQDIGLSSHLILDGFWEMWLTETIARLVKPGMTVVDAGANLGYYTLLMADLVGRDGSVLSFEPNGRIADRLQNSVDINGFNKITTVHRLALSDRDGRAFLKIPENEPKNAHLVENAADDSVVSTEVRRLDSLLNRHTFDFMKIDVEGAEEELWRGMEGILSKNHSMTIILEFNAGRYVDSSAFLGEISRHGFRIDFLDPTLGIITTTAEEILSRPPNEDQLLCLFR